MNKKKRKKNKPVKLLLSDVIGSITKPSNDQLAQYHSEKPLFVPKNE